MLKTENIEVMGWRGALRGMRNPYNSWKKADTEYEARAYQTPEGGIRTIEQAHIGPEDLKLMKKLAQIGSPDRKYLRMIHVQMDITAPLYWWKEYDTYKVGTVANSCSTMHKIAAKEFTIDDFSHEHMEEPTMQSMLNVLTRLNLSRKEFIKTKDKTCWWQMIQLLPSSYNQRRTVDFDYETAMAIWNQRHDHKLNEWHTLCDEIIALPYMRELLEVME